MECRAVGWVHLNAYDCLKQYEGEMTIGIGLMGQVLIMLYSGNVEIDVDKQITIGHYAHS